MRRQGLCDSSIESYEPTDSKNMYDKYRQSRGGAQESFEISSLRLPYSPTTGL